MQNVYVNAQEERTLNGILQFDDIIITNAFIENLSTAQRVQTDAEGAFQIVGKPGDTISLAHPEYNFVKLVLEERDFATNPFVVDLNQMSIELDDVILEDFSHINAYALGIIDHEMKVPTQNERRLYTAGDFKPIHLLSILGGSLQLDPIINKISGRTKRLKRYIEIDRRLENLEFLNENFGIYIKESLGIEEDERNRFLYYLVEETDIGDLIEENQETRLKFFIQDYWIRYQKLKSEK